MTAAPTEGPPTSERSGRQSPASPGAKRRGETAHVVSPSPSPGAKRRGASAHVVSHRPHPERSGGERPLTPSVPALTRSEAEGRDRRRRQSPPSPGAKRRGETAHVLSPPSLGSSREGNSSSVGQTACEPMRMRVSVRRWGKPPVDRWGCEYPFIGGASRPWADGDASIRSSVGQAAVDLGFARWRSPQAITGWRPPRSWGSFEQECHFDGARGTSSGPSGRSIEFRYERPPRTWGSPTCYCLG